MRASTSSGASRRLSPHEEIEHNGQQHADHEGRDDGDEDRYRPPLDDKIARQLAEPVQSRDPWSQYEQCAHRGEEETANQQKPADAGKVTHGALRLFLDTIVDPSGDAKDDHEQGGEEHNDDDQGDDRETALDQTLKPLGHPASPSAWRRPKTGAKYSRAALRWPSTHPLTPDPLSHPRQERGLAAGLSVLPSPRSEGLGEETGRE
jgi:hypothetical protein